MLKAVIFDLDGLLVDSTPLHQAANQKFIEGLGRIYLKPTSGREGMRIIDIVRDYKEIFDLPGSVESLYQKRQLIFLEIAWKKLKLFPGAEALIRRLLQRDLKLALSTSGDSAYVELFFNKFRKFKLCFSAVVTGDDVRRGKPYPDIYIKTLEKLKIKPHEAIVLEDSVNGIAASKAAGIQVICIPNRHYPDADYSLADKVFPTLVTVTDAIG